MFHSPVDLNAEFGLKVAAMNRALTFVEMPVIKIDIPDTCSFWCLQIYSAVD